MTFKEVMEMMYSTGLNSDFDEWHLCNNSGVTVAHIAATNKTLPKDFIRWELADNDGWTVAHYAVVYHELPRSFSQWGLKNHEGLTVAALYRLFISSTKFLNEFCKMNYQFKDKFSNITSNTYH